MIVYLFFMGFDSFESQLKLILSSNSYPHRTKSTYPRHFIQIKSILFLKKQKLPLEDISYPQKQMQKQVLLQLTHGKAFIYIVLFVLSFQIILTSIILPQNEKMIWYRFLFLEAENPFDITQRLNSISEMQGFELQQLKHRSPFYLLILIFIITFNLVYSRKLLTKILIEQMINILCLLVGLYITCSIFFFLFPTLIWGRKKYKNQKLNVILNSNKILRISHRGGPSHTTQNTIEGFSKIQKVTDCIEMDVCETNDKILVVHHDHHLKRTCGVDRDIQQYKFADLPSFLPEIVLDFAVKKLVKTNKQRIPTLQQVFKKFPNTMMNIELKTPTESAIVQIVRLIHEYKRVDNTIIGIRNNKNFELKRKNPQIMTFMNDKKVNHLLLAYFTGFIGLLRIDESSLQVPVYSTEYYNWDVGRTPQQRKWKTKLWMMMVKTLNFIAIPLMWHLKRRGIITMGWVCNTRQAYHNALKARFQGIMTDDPLLLEEYLKDKGLLIGH